MPLKGVLEISVRIMGRSSWPKTCGNGWRTPEQRLYIGPGAPRESGYCESINSKLRDEFLNGEIFYSLKEVQVLDERWRVHYKTV
jgi:Integrase core domain